MKFQKHLFPESSYIKQSTFEKKKKCHSSKDFEGVLVDTIDFWLLNQDQGNCSSEQRKSGYNLCYTLKSIGWHI